jgi:hypothetical protein
MVKEYAIYSFLNIIIQIALLNVRDRINKNY